MHGTTLTRNPILTGRHRRNTTNGAFLISPTDSTPSNSCAVHRSILPIRAARSTGSSHATNRTVTALLTRSGSKSIRRANACLTRTARNNNTGCGYAAYRCIPCGSARNSTLTLYRCTIHTRLNSTRLSYRTNAPHLRTRLSLRLRAAISLRLTGRYCVNTTHAILSIGSSNGSAVLRRSGSIAATNLRIRQRMPTRHRRHDANSGYAARICSRRTSCNSTGVTRLTIRSCTRRTGSASSALTCRAVLTDSSDL